MGLLYGLIHPAAAAPGSEVGFAGLQPASAGMFPRQPHCAHEPVAIT